MNRLFRIGRIERAEVWRGIDRKPVFGLQEVAGNGAGDCAGDARETVKATEAGNGAGNAGRTHTIPKGVPGGAHQAPAPSEAGGVE